jgi:hypothetical protein
MSGTTGGNEYTLRSRTAKEPETRDLIMWKETRQLRKTNRPEYFMDICQFHLFLFCPNLCLSCSRSTNLNLAKKEEREYPFTHLYPVIRPCPVVSDYVRHHLTFEFTFVNEKLRHTQVRVEKPLDIIGLYTHRSYYAALSMALSRNSTATKSRSSSSPAHK